MDFSRKDLLTNRIVSGTVRIKVEGHPLLIKTPSRLHRYIASEIYEKTLHKNKVTEDLLLGYLINKDLWNQTKENRLKNFEKDIEKLKEGLCDLVFRESDWNDTKRMLKIAKTEYNKLLQEKSKYFEFTNVALATLAKNRYLFAHSLHNKNGLAIKNYWKSRSDLIDKAISKYNKIKLTEEDYRELARSDPWRSIWNQNEDVFGIPSTDYSEEQRILCNWSMLYDNIYECAEAPHEKIINDDDALDGWLIKQRKTRETEVMKNTADSLMSDKIKGADEVFLVANTDEDANKINNLNENYVRQVRKQRERLIMKKGEVAEVEMPDTKQKVIMQFNQKRQI